MMLVRPPAHAWDWFARQRLLWREARSRLADATTATATAAAYAAASTKAEVLGLLRSDYLADAVVRDVVRSVVRDLAFLGRTDVPFADLRVAHPPRGMRWWWHELTGEAVDDPPSRREVARRARDRQLTLDDVLGGYGDVP